MNQSGSDAERVKRIVFLDYLRIFAFMSVLIGHRYYDAAVDFVNDAGVHATPRLLLEFLLPLFQGGGAGVVVFFLVSGYIITLVLQTEQPMDFVLKRIFRIYPLYMVAVLLQATATALLGGKFPEWSVLIPQLLLIGDFFGTPYTLGGVEWTLRLEILFYAYMAAARKLGLLHAHRQYFPGLLAVTALILFGLAPIPAQEIWSKGYVTLYGPFLLLGSVFYLREIRQVGSWTLFGAVLLVLGPYYHLIAVHQQAWINSHFATLSILIFTVCWASRAGFTATPVVILLSDLTYSVYLFHNWALGYMKSALQRLQVEILHPEVQVLPVFFLFCYLALRFIERPGIRLGKRLIARGQGMA